MKKTLKTVLNLGQMDTTPSNVKGVHFIARVIDFGDRKSVTVACPSNQDKARHKISLSCGLYGQLKSIKSDALYLLIERKGPFEDSIFKIKDYDTDPIWNQVSYDPKLPESIICNLVRCNAVAQMS